MAEDLNKELILINPKCGNLITRNVMALATRFFPPVSLLVLSALTPRDYKLRVYNQRTLWHKGLFKRNILVAITCFSANAKRAYALADRYRQAGAYVVMGGPHVSFLPEEALKHCHSVVIGEAESVWAQVVNDYQNQNLKQVYKGEPLDDFFSPSFEYFKKLPTLVLLNSIQTTRGCKNACDFCAIAGLKLRFIRQEQVIELIRLIKEKFTRPFIYLKDDNIYSDPEYAKKLFRLLIGLKIRWYSFASIDIAQDDEALSLAKQSGCHNLTIGLETIYPARLAKAGRANVKSREEYLVLLKRIRSYGIKVRGAFIMGFDYDRLLDYLRLIIFLLRARLYFVVLGILTPFPGSFLYTRLKRENRILHYNWDKYDCMHVVIRPKNMASWQLRVAFIFTRFTTLFLGSQSLVLMLLLIIVSAGFILINFPNKPVPSQSPPTNWLQLLQR